MGTKITERKSYKDWEELANTLENLVGASIAGRWFVSYPSVARSLLAFHGYMDRKMLFRTRTMANASLDSLQFLIKERGYLDEPLAV